MSTTLSNEQFIQRANIVHNHKYDYDCVNVTSPSSVAMIVCEEHGMFFQDAYKHLKGYGCPKCFDVINKTEVFKRKASAKHKNKYDYSKIEFFSSYSMLNIICPIHGEFEQVAYAHLAGSGCPKCSKKKPAITKNEFIDRASKTHGDKYDYSNIEYHSTRSIINISCPIHGDFEQVAYLHLRGSGCPQCGKKKPSITTDQFIERARSVHGDRYEYSNTVYTASNKKVKITCKKHGDFEQLPNAHIKGSGCPKCFFESKSSTTEQFIEKAKKIHGNKYDYSKVEYKHSKEYVTIACPIHGDFQHTPSAHLLGYICPECFKYNIDTKI